ncbi:hypothetical protein [Mycobacterium sp. Aquia_213]|uniref:hypothetical protein n=1 Tax=Mycobacterium sp. Aquia_213 TaxID=2991728 RepID=UPI00226E92D8|nr:hypothetical protein [Mycobacterium sp. Aquia_213]WAC90300.1 hypothetical protein LMQ14_20565 [Mycobacterium sp. Aquia_213]
MWRRPRPCDSHAHDYYGPCEPNESYELREPNQSCDPNQSYEPGAAYELREPNESCHLDEPGNPNESHKLGGSGRWTVTTSE